MQHLPEHLKKYVVEQDQDGYTSIDQACWRYVMRQLRAFLKTRAHPSYLEGLEKTGISADRIPLISEISQNLEKFGWRALPVSGFIPPGAFMELQSLGILPIASDMRSLDHLEYTPAPDIVHEAAGHAPILVNLEFASYLRQYAEVANKAIMSREDLELYAAIRDLSDLKENPNSNENEIQKAQDKLDAVSKAMTSISEAGLLARMNWWTAEYGLIGDLENPKIYGAGLLSSVGESKWCLSAGVKKLPLTIDCIYQSYDITEPQPQLFVTPSFSHLSVVLEEMSQMMAYKRGGLEGLDRAIEAQTVCTVELDSGLQISGIFERRLATPANPAGNEKARVDFFKTTGPTQLCYLDHQLSGHGTHRHPTGFSSPIGPLKGQSRPLSELSDLEFKGLGIEVGKRAHLEFASGIWLEGSLTKILEKNGRSILASFTDVRVTGASGEVLFEPAWGDFDLTLGGKVVSVFGRAADPRSYAGLDHFKAHRVPKPIHSKEAVGRQTQYSLIRRARETGLGGPDLMALCQRVEAELQAWYPDEWLLRLEMLELLEMKGNVKAAKTGQTSSEIVAISAELEKISRKNPRYKELIESGLGLIGS